MFDDWTRAEVLQLAGNIIAGLAIIVGVIVALMVRHVRVLINSRLTQMLAGAHAQGQVQERGEADSRRTEPSR